MVILNGEFIAPRVFSQAEPVKKQDSDKICSFSLISAKPDNRIKPALHHLCDTLRATQQAISSNAIITARN
ncbi:hypothetical protein BK797_05875 [Kosakonia sacchari]|nr:hypothetical protein BK797_05875 [Kosakonia sacchari]